MHAANIAHILIYTIVCRAWQLRHRAEGAISHHRRAELA